MRPLRAAAIALLWYPLALTAQIGPQYLSGLVWRNVGPFRGGRVAAVSGAIGRPGVFYAGMPAGGVWKTTSAGTTWFPIFDSVKAVSSIGAVEVAPSNPSVVYVGTGDIVGGDVIDEGNGMYKSVDGGQTWQHLGLDSTKHIPAILVDPKDPNVVLIASEGDVRAKSEARGVFRSTDGGRTWTRTLFVDDETGIQKFGRAFDVPDVVFATALRQYTPPAAARGAGRSTADLPMRSLFKSTDGGITWTEIIAAGLPRINGRAAVAVAMNTSAQRVFVVTNQGLWRSDDGGTTWRQTAGDDDRIRNGQGGFNCGVYVDSKNPDVVYVFNTTAYRSTDGGSTFTGFKGAPGGDDPQVMWIDPTDNQRLFMGYDQGAIVSLDGGATWSSWYNQSNEQVYHISVDNSFPPWIYASQQDAGGIRTRSRGNLGAITSLDWTPVPGAESGTPIADPLNPNIVYASGSGIVKIMYPSEQWINVSPSLDPRDTLRTSQSQPLIWAPWNPHELLAGFQVVMSTVDGGVHWTKISPDLGKWKGTPPPGAPLSAPIGSMSASPFGKGTIWVGTTNGQIHLTRDHGKTWRDVSISAPRDSATGDIVSVDASPTDAGGAYVAVDQQRRGDYTPYFYRTHDFGKTWTRITTGLPVNEVSGSFARVIRADTKRAGLLFAGTESGMYISFDDGAHWQSLSVNLPNTSYRDVVVAGNDLVVGTYGRGIWILDDISPLRQLPLETTANAHLFAPGIAIRVRRNVGADTPFPPEVPQALNPPDGTLLYYVLAKRPTSDVMLDISDASGRLVRHLSSVAPPPVPEAARPREPNFWIAPPLALSTNVGTNRTNWDLRYDPPPAFTHSFEINANPGLTPPSPEGPLVVPGVYMVRLSVDGQSYIQKVTVTNDPRSPANAAALGAQHGLQLKIYDALRTARAGYDAAVAAKQEVLAGNPRGGRGAGGGRGGPAQPPTFVQVSSSLASQLNVQDKGDMDPTPSMLAAFAARCADLRHLVTRLNKATSGSLAAPRC